MLEQQEKLWDYDAVEAGQTGPTTEVEITEENISEYALLAQNPDPRFQRPGVSRENDGAMLPRRSYFSNTRRLPVMVSPALTGPHHRISHLAKGV